MLINHYAMCDRVFKNCNFIQRICSSRLIIFILIGFIFHGVSAQYSQPESEENDCKRGYIQYNEDCEPEFNFCGSVLHSVTGGIGFEDANLYLGFNTVSNSIQNSLCLPTNELINIRGMYHVSVPCKIIEGIKVGKNYSEGELSAEEIVKAYINVHIYRNDSLMPVDVRYLIQKESGYSISYEDRNVLEYTDYVVHCGDNYMDCISNVRVEIDNFGYTGSGIFRNTDYVIAFILEDVHSDHSDPNCLLPDPPSLSRLREIENGNCHLAEHIVLQTIPFCNLRRRSPHFNDLKVVQGNLRLDQKK